MAVFQRFFTWKRALIDGEYFYWSNSYIINFTSGEFDQEYFGGSLAASETVFHMSNVEFTHVTACEATNIPGENYARDMIGTVASEMKTRVFPINEDYQFGTREYQGEGWEQWALRVSRDNPGMRKGYSWYIGALGPNDVSIDIDGFVAVKDVHFWRVLFNEYVAYWWDFDPWKFSVQRLGQNYEKFGPFTGCTEITVRGANKTGAIMRGKKRVPRFRFYLRDTMFEAMKTAAQLYKEINIVYFEGTDFNPESLRSHFLHILDFSFAAAVTCLVQIYSDNTGEIQEAPFLISRFGPTQGDLLASIGIVVTGTAESPESSEAFNVAVNEVTEMEPAIHFAGVDYFSHAQIADLRSKVELFYFAACQLMRGDYCVSQPRSWPPPPV